MATRGHGVPPRCGTNQRPSPAAAARGARAPSLPDRGQNLGRDKDDRAASLAKAACHSRSDNSWSIRCIKCRSTSGKESGSRRSETITRTPVEEIAEPGRPSRGKVGTGEDDAPAPAVHLLLEQSAPDAVRANRAGPEPPRDVDDGASTLRKWGSRSGQDPLVARVLQAERTGKTAHRVPRVGGEQRLSHFVALWPKS